MRPIIVSLCTFLVALSPGSSTAATSEKEFTKNLTIKALDSDKGDVGLDYSFQWKPQFKTNSDPDHGLTAKVLAKGFLVKDRAENTANAVDFAADFGWKTAAKLPEGWAPPPPPEVDIGSLTPKELQAYAAQRSASLNSVAQFGFTVEPKFTATQDFKSHTANVGPILRASVPWPILFHKMFAIRTRTIHANLGYEYVADQKYDSKKRESEMKNRKNLAALGLRTSLDFRDDITLDIEYRGAYFFEKTIPANALPTFAGFIYIRATFLKFSGMGLTNGKLAAVYSVGRLPPLYVKGQSLGGGFFLEF